MQKAKKFIIIFVVIAAVAGAGWYFYNNQSKLDEIKGEARQEFYKAKGKVSSSTQSPKGDPQSAAACKENLKRIESAKRQIASQKGLATGTISRDEILKVLGSAPKCPSGGTYSFNDIGRMPSCSVGSAGTSTPDDDHVILVY